MDSRDLNLVKRFKIPIPKILLQKAFNRLLKEVAETLNKSALEKEIESGILRTKLYNKAFNLYPALVQIVSLSWDQKHLDMIKEITGFELTKLEDRKVLIEETQRLQSKYREFIVEKPSEGVSFTQVIVSVEIVLNMAISREIKLFEFQYYMKSASDKIKQLEKRTA
jgi:hypothetical protein